MSNDSENTIPEKCIFLYADKYLTHLIKILPDLGAQSADNLLYLINSESITDGGYNVTGYEHQILVQMSISSQGNSDI